MRQSHGSCEAVQHLTDRILAAIDEADSLISAAKNDEEAYDVCQKFHRDIAERVFTAFLDGGGHLKQLQAAVQAACKNAEVCAPLPPLPLQDSELHLRLAPQPDRGDAASEGPGQNVDYDWRFLEAGRDVWSALQALPLIIFTFP